MKFGMKVEEIVAYIGIFVLMTLTIATITTIFMYMTMPSSYTFNMYFKHGIYIFTSSGKYYYYPVLKNTSLLINTGGSLVIDGYVYINSTTVQPGYHYVVVIPFRTHFDINKSLLNGALISIIILMLLHRLLSKVYTEEV